MGLSAFAIVWLLSGGQRNHASHLQTVPLVKGNRTVGLPLLGVAVDPTRRDVYAIVGQPAKNDRAGHFVIVWKGNDGETYGTTFGPGNTGATLCEENRNGQVRTLHQFHNGTSELASGTSGDQNAEDTFRYVLDSLADDSLLHARK
jgi:hypothetical protein